MPVPSSSPLAEPEATRPPRDIDSVIRELRRINLSQRLDRLHTDIVQLSDMERWKGLYVRCPGPEPEDLCCEPPSSGYSTGSGSPPVSQDGAAGAEAAEVYAETEVKRPICDGEATLRPVKSLRDEFLAGNGHSYRQDRLIEAKRRPKIDAPAKPEVITSAVTLAGFRPAAASTPRQGAPRSPKTLRFAAQAELIASDSPCRQKPSTLAPRHGILRTTQLRNEAARRPLDLDERTQSEADGDASMRIRHAMSMLRRLENDLNRNCTPASPGGTFGTAQFVSSPPAPRQPLEPLVVVTSSTDITRDVMSQTTELSDDEADFPSRISRPRPQMAARRADITPLSEPSEDESVRWRRSKNLNPGPLRRSRRRLARLLNWGRRASPAPLKLATPPHDTPPSKAPYQCNICGVRLSQHYALVVHVHQRHRRLHVRPKYACGLCPARFFASKVLAKHCAYHHMGAGDKRTPHCLKVRRIV